MKACETIIKYDNSSLIVTDNGAVYKEIITRLYIISKCFYKNRNIIRTCREFYMHL